MKRYVNESMKFENSTDGVSITWEYKFKKWIDARIELSLHSIANEFSD
jgi:hypothetical protein